MKRLEVDNTNLRRFLVSRDLRQLDRGMRGFIRRKKLYSQVYLAYMARAKLEKHFTGASLNLMLMSNPDSEHGALDLMIDFLIKSRSQKKLRQANRIVDSVLSLEDNWPESPRIITGVFPFERDTS